MKFALQMTLDGMIRALRMKAHEMGEDYHEARLRARERNDAVLALLAEESRRSASENIGGRP